MKIKPLSLKDVEISGSFWSRYMDLVINQVIPYQWEALNDRVSDAARSGCVHNFEVTAGRKQGEFYGMVFQDSDLYKWLECVAYSLAVKPDPVTEKLADNVIELIGAAQSPDGYINTYYTIKEPKRRWTNLQHGHELYCAGHLIEAAIAYHDATGKTAFLDIAKRFADCIDGVFGLEEGKLKGYPGHQEIELALYKLFETTGEKRYLNLALYFINERGKSPNYFDEEQQKPEYREIFPELTLMARTYSQSHIPPVEQRIATGHAVRAVYMYSAMADLAVELNNQALADACDALYDDITTKQMYITGAIGAVAHGERFTSAYDLPNDLIYGETCASVGLMMFCRRLNTLHANAKYADTMELALYNTVLAGMSLTGKNFFYVNPLEVEPKKIPFNPNYNHIKPERPKWFDCACCPSNLARTITGLGLYAYGRTTDALYINLYCEGSAKDGEREVKITTAYPFGDVATLTVSGGRFKLYLRNPSAAPIQSVTVDGKPIEFSFLMESSESSENSENLKNTENGYIVIERDWQDDNIVINFEIQPKYIYCAGELQQNAGKAAVMRGPIVYCAEEVDNGQLLSSYILYAQPTISSTNMPDGLLSESDCVALSVGAYKYKHSTGDGLYRAEKPELQPFLLRLIPYFLWANRGENEMRVFMPVLHTLT
jgi:DUF1680 family protein